MTSDDPVFFVTPDEFRAWLRAHYDSAGEVWVGIHKKATGRPTVTWPEAVEQALCFGWIDGLRRSVDEASYEVRFTPRREGSSWSVRNVHTAEELARRGLMTPAGLRAFEERDARQTERGSRVRDEAQLPIPFEKRFRESPRAWEFYEAQSPYYRKTTTAWVMSAKREATQRRRLETLIADSAAGRRIAALRR